MIAVAIAPATSTSARGGAAVFAFLPPGPPTSLHLPFSRRRAQHLFSRHHDKDKRLVLGLSWIAALVDMDDLKRMVNGHSGGLPQHLPGSRSPAPGFLPRLKTSFEGEQPISTRTSSSWWNSFYLFEAPRRRTLSSTNAPPSTLKFCVLCALWYSSSALSSNTGKVILDKFKYPVTLTFIQFAFVAGYCLLFTSPLIQFSRLKKPTRAIFESTLPMGAFQVGGHIFSSMAISRIPVSTTHTIKVRLIIMSTFSAL